MKKILASLCCTAVIMMFAACGGSPVDNALEKIDASISKIENSKNMTKAEFEVITKEMEEPLQMLNKALEEDQVGPLDKIKIIGKVAEWTATVAKVGIDAIGDELDEELEDNGLTEDEE